MSLKPNASNDPRELAEVLRAAPLTQARAQKAVRRFCANAVDVDELLAQFTDDMGSQELLRSVSPYR